MSTNSKRVVIIGGGFGGLRAARALRRAPVQVTLIDRTNHHLFQPLLYQVATASLPAEEIAIPIRSVLRDQVNTEVILGDVQSVQLHARSVHLADGSRMAYDYLIVAAGAQTHYHGHSAWEQHSFGLKTLDDAYNIRRRVLLAFEAAEREPDRDKRQRLLTFVVIGGGPTGVEMAGAISELGRAVITRDFRQLDGSMLRVVLVEMGERVLAPFDAHLSESARGSLEDLRVQVRTHTRVLDINNQGVQLDDEFIPSAVVVWAAGVTPRPLAKNLGIPVNSRGYVDVEQDCSIPDFPEAFVIGDMAAFVPPDSEHPLPGLAPVAMQQGTSVAQNIVRSLHDEARVPFEYVDKGIMATIGTSQAVLQFGPMRMSGFTAWLAWIAVHVFYIIGFSNRALVLMEWALAYITHRRGARLINDTSPNLAALAVQPRPVAEKPADKSA